MPAWKLGYEANCWGALGGDAVGVTSIKDLYYRTFGDPLQAIEEVAEAGFRGIEFFDGNLVDQAGALPAFRGHLERAGIQLIGAYSGANFIFPDVLEEELWRLERVAQVTASAGGVHLVVGGGAQRAGGATDADYDSLGKALDRVCDLADRHGLQAHFHPHLTTIAETPEQVARVFERTRIHFCPDTAHLAAGGCDPAALIRQYADRISYVHLKDLRREPFEFLPLGEGDLDMDGIVQALVDVNFEGWVTVELDAHADPKEAAKVSAQYLHQAMRTHGIAKAA